MAERGKRDKATCWPTSQTISICRTNHHCYLATMDLNKFTEQAAAALGSAQEEATRLGNQAVDVEHLFYALLTQENGLVPRLFERLKTPLDLLLTKTQSA